MYKFQNGTQQTLNDCIKQCKNGPSLNNCISMCQITISPYVYGEGGVYIDL